MSSIKLGKSTRSPARALPTWESVQPLIKLYNLHKCTPDAVKSYFGKYASHLFIEGAPPERFEMDAIQGKTRVYGTLEHFRKSEGRDWFESEYFDKFCILRADLCDLLDRYANNTLRVVDLVELQELMQDFSPTLAFRERESNRLLTIAAVWGKPFDAQKWELIFGGLVETGWALERYKLNIGELLAQLVFGLYKILQWGMPVLRCQNKGCKNIFIPRPGAPTGATAPKYCPSCRYKRKRI